VVTNRLGASLFAEATYDEYTERGESENRNKERKSGMAADRRERPSRRGEPAASLHARRGGQPLVRLRQVAADPPALLY
jgi:hypothetical protein